MHHSTIGWRNFIYPGFRRWRAHSTSPKWWQGCSLRGEHYWTMQPSDSWSRDMVRCRCVSWSKPCFTTRVCSSRWCYAADLLRSHWARNDTFECQSIWSCLEYAETHRSWIAGSTPKSSSGLTWRTVVGRFLPCKPRGQPCRCQWSLKASVSQLASNRTELDGKWSNMWGPNNGQSGRPAFGFWGCRGLSLDVVRPAIIRPCFSVFFRVFDRELARPNHAHRDRIGSKESLFGYRTEIRRSETKLRIC